MTATGARHMQGGMRAAFVLLVAAAAATSIVVVGARSSTTVAIVCNDSTGKPVARVAPSRCEVLPPQASFSQGVNLAVLKWRSWGGSSATGTGFELGFHLPFAHVSVAVVAYRIIECRNGTRLYSRLRASSSYGTTNVRAQGCLTP
jgi:hypothetical protein